MKYLLRAVLAVAMLVGFYVLAVGLSLALALAVLQVLELVGVGLVGAKVLFLAVPALLALGYGAFFRHHQPDPPGILLTEQDQPRLWAMAREIARSARASDVDEIRLVPEANASVEDSSSWMGLRPGTRRMYVGVPLLIALDGPQIKAVIAHELGHYSGGHTTLVRITYRGAESIRRTLSQLGRRNPVAAVLRLYGSLYFAMSRSVNRRQELEADRLGAELTSPEVMASALLELDPAAYGWVWYGHVYTVMGMQIGRRPDGVLAGFAEFLDDPEVVEKLREVREAPDHEPSVYDTHPPIGRRVAALGLEPPVRRARLGWAVELLDRPDETLAVLERELYDPTLVPTPIDVLAPLAADEAAGRHARLVDDVLISQGRPPGLRTVLQCLGTGMSRELLRHELTDVPDEEQLTDITAETLGGYLAAALISVGRATHRLDWRRGCVLVDAEGHDLDLVELVREVMANPRRVMELDELLRLTGVPTDFRSAPHEAAPPRQPGDDRAHIRGLITPVNRSQTLVVHEDGVVLVKETSWRRLARSGRGVLVSELVATPGARSLGWTDIEQLRRIQLAKGQDRIIATVRNGAPLDIKVGPRSGQGGQPFDAMRDHLGTRYRAEERVGTRV